MTRAATYAEPAPKTFLKPAVHQSKLFSRKGLNERLFTAWFGGFVYNQIWEDPRVDLQALRITPDESKILQISSGGCNVLNYLVAKPARIVAVDLNRHHMYLTRLKLAAAQHLPDHAAFFQFFGCGDTKPNVAAYHQHIKHHLDPGTRAYWERRPKLTGPFRKPRIEYFGKNFYNQSKLGLLLRVTHALSHFTRMNPARILELKTVEEQKAYFDEHIDPFFNRKVVRFLGRVPLVGFSLGIPPHQHDAMMKECDGQVIDLYRERARKLLCDFPIKDNYFAWQAVSRRYDRENREGIPDYLKAENFETVRAMAPRVETHVTSLTERLHREDVGGLDRFVFLDSQDWMPPEVLTELWTEIARVAPVGARVVFRTASSVSPLEDGLPAELLARFTAHRDEADELFKQDRSAIYGGFHIYEKTA
ncbi:MAG: DUF3419 family protein [Phycisphaeraceae bacterium]